MAFLEKYFDFIDIKLLIINLRLVKWLTIKITSLLFCTDESAFCGLIHEHVLCRKISEQPDTLQGHWKELTLINRTHLFSLKKCKSAFAR